MQAVEHVCAGEAGQGHDGWLRYVHQLKSTLMISSLKHAYFAQTQWTLTIVIQCQRPLWVVDSHRIAPFGVRLRVYMLLLLRKFCTIGKQSNGPDAVSANAKGLDTDFLCKQI
ncbi:hypothetical protein GCM10007418_32620 [Halopseudomonas salina]|uniref:Uncharacterized protein n=1 Tax=Halopseudomonas salina TaxID=1323744 RepID=A0ABQ1Q3I4_9GAMM|nr:hypothetical protein GCM10007418_32620 [Halopseudomonas salina]